MIERFDLDAKGQADPNGAWFWVDEVEHLLRPPTWIVDPVKGDNPVHYTPAQWRQWFVDNRLPPQEYIGPVWIRDSLAKETGWELCQLSLDSVVYDAVMYCVSTNIIIANEAGKPPDDYACES